MMSRADRRAIAVGLHAVVIMLIARFAVLPLASHAQQTRHEAAMERMLLARDHERIRSAAELTGQPDGAGRSSSKEIARQADPLLLQAEFEDMLDMIGRGSSVTTESYQWIGLEEAAADIAAMRVRVSGRSDYEGILRFLWTVEQSAALVTIESVAMLLEQAAEASPTGAEAIHLEATLLIYFDGGPAVDRPSAPDPNPMRHATGAIQSDGRSDR